VVALCFAQMNSLWASVSFIHCDCD